MEHTFEVTVTHINQWDRTKQPTIAGAPFVGTSGEQKGASWQAHGEGVYLNVVVDNAPTPPLGTRFRATLVAIDDEN